MPNRRWFAGLALATAFALSLTGCSSKLRLDMSRTCQAHGGTWSQAQETCTMSAAGASAASKQAKDICAYQGGTYLPGGTCLLDLD
jgi:hypothetical protein